MKKFYFMALSFALGVGGAQAQSNSFGDRILKESRYATGQETPPRVVVNNGADRGAAFWTEDFSTPGIPAGWTNEDVGTPGGGTPVVFEWSNDPDAVGVAALGYIPSSTFQAGSASNGYLWANSDRGLVAAPSAEHTTVLTTDAVDCSDRPTVLLSFQSLIGVFDLNANENAVVRVSTDMVNWDVYQPFPCLVTGGAAPPCVRWSSNPQMIELDISATAANQPMVYIQWRWQGLWEYFWAIDDVMLTAVPDFSRQLVSTYISHVGEGLEYARIPSDQFLSEFILGGQVRNNGLAAQNNLTLNMMATGPGGIEFSATETVASIAPGDTATFEQFATLPASMPEGLYTIEFSITSDEDAEEHNPDDDMDTRVFEVNNILYSLDGIGVHPTADLITTSLGTNSFEDAEDALLLLTYFEVTSSMTVYGLEALLAGGTVANSSVIMSVHASENIDLEDIGSPFVETDIITVTAANISSGSVNGLFDSPLTLDPGGYYAAVELLSNAGANHIRILDDVTIPQPGGASLINIPGDQIYGNGNAHAIRLLLDPSVSINEQDQLSVSIYPNPTNGLVNIMMAETGAYDVEVLNLLGERVHTTRIVNNAVIDLSGNAQGVYMVRISNENASTVERITLN